MDKVKVLSLGAGVQSSALLLAYSDGTLPEPPAFAVFADTQAEPKRVYDWLDTIRAHTSIPIVVSTKGDIIEDYMGEGRAASIPFFLKDEKGKKGMAWRQCTKEYKIEVVQKAVRTQLGYIPRQRMKHHIDMQIGISMDEVQRMKPSRIKWIENHYPLIDILGWDRTDCFEYLVSKGIGEPPKSACYICPYRSDESWAHMKRNDKDSWDKAVEFDKQIRERPRLKNPAYLHCSLVPLDEVDFEKNAPNDYLFDNECEGMCGV